MRIIVTKDYQELSRWAAQLVAGLIRGKENCILGLPTGSTPIGMYAELVEMHHTGLNMQDVHTFNLGEYVGLSPEHPESYHHFMRENLFKHVNIPADQYNIPNGMALDLSQECERYEGMIQDSGGIDLMILGLGPNGHIGFNEPDSQLGTKTHVVSLTPETIQANARFFPNADLVPRQAITMGVGSIMQSKEMLLLVSGEGKRKVLQDALFGQVTTAVPASVLQLHPHLVVVTDFSL